jgi:hypothetical protein
MEVSANFIVKGATENDVEIENASSYPSSSSSRPVTLRDVISKYVPPWPEGAKLTTPAQLWNALGNIGCFIGNIQAGGPFSDAKEKYNDSWLTDPARSPFERLYVKKPSATDQTAFWAYRLKPHREARASLSDPMERLTPRSCMNKNGRKTGVIIAPLPEQDEEQEEEDEEDEEYFAEPVTECDEKELIAEYGADLDKWV